MRALVGWLTPFAVLLLALTSATPAEKAPIESAFRFTDVTGLVGLSPEAVGPYNHAAAWGDFDNDGRLDLFLGSFAERGGGKGPGNMLLRQTAGGRFERFPCPPIEVRGRCSGAVFVDLDNDGDLDLYVSSNRFDKPMREPWRHAAQLEGCRLYRNDGHGKLVDVSASCGACPATLFYCRDIGVFDYDQDGLLDLLVQQDTVVRQDEKTFGTRLFRNLGELKFADVTAQAGLPADLWGLGIAVADLNGDRRPDFYVCGPDRLYLSQANKTYREADTLRGVFDHRGKDLDRVTGAAFGDLDLDGDLDLATGPHNYFGPSRIRLFLNKGIQAGCPQFRDITRDVGIPALPHKAPHVEIQDFDNDGHPDLYWSAHFAEGTRRWPFICKGLGVKDGLPRFQVPSVANIPMFFSDEGHVRTQVPANGVGMVYYVDGPAVDYDGDGDLDFFCGNWVPEGSRFFRNDTKGGNWLQVKVEGKKMNRMGIGAQVRVYPAGDKKLLGFQEISVNVGYSSSRPALVHFGLGKIEACDVEVRLPSRPEPLVQRQVKANQVLLVREP